jgi:predicted TPR repeat methyltransferase
MSTPDDVLQRAMNAHDAGRLTEAEVGYSRVLRKRPTDYQALYGLGVMSFFAGAADRGIQYMTRSLESAPGHGRGWNALGSMYLATGRTVEAKDAYRKATEVTPDMSDAWFNVGLCLQREGDLDGAAEQFRRAIACPVPTSGAFGALAALYNEQGRLTESAQTVAEWVRREPDHPIAVHMAAAAGASNGEIPSRASDAYVRILFDSVAEGFDRSLGGLKYCAPELVANALNAAAATGSHVPLFPVVLDAGCGTGLCGPPLRALCRTLVGVDLSPNMLAQAKRRGCYDELVNGELVAFLRSRPAAFDAIVCADTFIYFGDLAEALAAAHGALRAGGPLILTVEALPEEEGIDHRLEFSGRYAHSETYLRRALAANGFEVQSLTRETLRQERGSAAGGYVVHARREQAGLRRTSTPAD